MNNVHLNILGSNPFLDILNELEFNNITNSSTQLKNSAKESFVKILFAESLKIKDIKFYLLQNEPTILFFKNKNFIKENNLNLLNFPLCLL